LSATGEGNNFKFFSPFGLLYYQLCARISKVTEYKRMAQLSTDHEVAGS
jgi:hypothetical protein